MSNALYNLSQHLDLKYDTRDILIIVHGADGSVAPFYAFAGAVNKTVIAISYDHAFVGHCSTIEEFAKLYWDEVVKQYPDRTYTLAGYSYGSLVAYEMAAFTTDASVFMIDPNLPLAMRNYSADRLHELRVLASTITSDKLVSQYDENHLLSLLKRCLKQERIEAILSARKHCLSALSKYVYNDRPNLRTYMIHAAEKLGFDFIDEETKWIRRGFVVPGNHFTMLQPGNIEHIAKIILGSVL